MKRFTLSLALAAFTFTGQLRAQVPQLLNYQGRVAVDAVNFEGTGQFKFALVNADGSTTYWSNDGTSTIGDEPAAAVPLTVAKGLYSVLLGDDSLSNMVAVPASVFANPDVRLRVWFDDGINGSQLLSPDQRIAAVGYAMIAGGVADGAITPNMIAPGSITGDRIAPGSFDFTHLLTLAPPAAGEVLSFDGANLFWTSPGGGGGGGAFALNGTSAYYNGGFVGIGRNNPVAKLDLYDTGSIVERIESGGGVGAGTVIQFGNLNGDWNIGTSRSLANDAFYVTRNSGGVLFSIQPNGSIFTNGDVTYAGKFAKLDTSEQFTATVRTADFFLGHSSRRGTPGRALVDNGSSLVVNFASDWGTTVIGGAVTQVRALQITGGADLTEPFAMSQQGVEPGMVVVIDDANPGKLRRSASSYDRKVAGIVSGAGGIHAGISMIQENALEAGENVALSGRVFVKANSSGGGIAPGDLLTTSDVPGEAMKAADHERAQGAIIGKAMTALSTEAGEVLVLVTLQ